MQLAMREGWWREAARALGSALGIGAVLAITGPFGSQTAMAPAPRTLFWMALTFAGVASALVAGRLLPRFDRSWLRWAAIAAASAVPMAFVVAWANGVVRPGRTYSPLQMLALYPYVALVQLGIARVLFPPPVPVAAPGLAPPTSADPAPAYPAELIARLPPALRHGLCALEAEDHYLRVHTRQGSTLVLMRLADAAAAIPPALGARVHRSWWVARAGVEAVERRRGRWVVILAGGREVPVSRASVAAARALLDPLAPPA